MKDKIKRLKIKLDPVELRTKSVKVLEEMKKTLERHITKARVKKLLDKGVNIKEERKNIARINTIIKEKKYLKNEKICD